MKGASSWKASFQTSRSRLPCKWSTPPSTLRRVLAPSEVNAACQWEGMLRYIRCTVLSPFQHVLASSSVGFCFFFFFPKQQEADLPEPPDHHTGGPVGLRNNLSGRRSEDSPLILSHRISNTEKGALDLMLQVNMTPSHSSAPPKETSIGILSAAVSR